ncbi:uncharacterized protein PV07_04469 [Cladophialophora immunda]|uniref:Uncharacterized protein n=1 Tax=Cladophialophora immunda TaxID=569365 RepID=A0A0D2B5X3_9EURO|nr:uncharacterized protein PV07_04469 [Cladophialophora immunda]KIW32962.1 hypothetical protein PV07_04469 [Cladophialophora immunda]
MPVTPLSDRKMEVNYAIDLLKAHQIRRENALLHEQLKTCVKELTALREEMREMKANRLAAVENELKPIKESMDNVMKVTVLMERHETQLNDQTCEIQALQQLCKTMQTETSHIKASCRETQENQQTQMTMVERQIGAVRTACENQATAQEQQDQQTLASLENLKSALDGKADAGLVKLLESRVNELSRDRNAGAVAVAVDSVSHISDTAERSSPLHEPDESVQVQDSQHGNPQRHEPFGRPVPQQPREMTVPDDLDLDANAHTISYVGHECRVPEQNDSLKMLSPSTGQATQLAEIKTLRQRRFDGWDTYYNQGQKLVQALPQDFEGIIVRNFVDGLFKDTHRKQCQQWLDSSAWTWANVTLFGNLCSQLLAENASKEAMETETSARPRQIGAALAAVSKSGHDADGVKNKKRNRGKVQLGNVDAPLRRSQRVAEKQNHTISNMEQQREVNSKLMSLVHSAERDIAQESKPKNKPGNVRTRTQKQPQSANATEPRARLREPEKEAEKTQGLVAIARSIKGATVRAEGLKRTASAVEIEPSVKRLKSRPTAWTGDRHDISIPQLVAFRERNGKSVEESSNDEGFLYKANVSKPSISIGARQRTGHKRGLPLPPPPEIPILPTSDEE